MGIDAGDGYGPDLCETTAQLFIGCGLGPREISVALDFSAFRLRGGI
jgi:hypothetical protein